MQHFATAIKIVAKQIAALDKEIDKGIYYENELQYALVAEQYQEALAYLDAEVNTLAPGDSLHAVAIAFPFKMYTNAKLFQQKHNTSFEDAFKSVFATGYHRLSPQQRVVAGMYPDPPAIVMFLI